MTLKIFEPYNKGRNGVKDRSTISAFKAYTHIFARHFKVGKVHQVKNIRTFAYNHTNYDIDRFLLITNGSHASLLVEMVLEGRIQDLDSI
jgi:hypothetical protein